MKILSRLTVYVSGKERTVLFGMPENSSDIEDMHRLRRIVYQSRGYFHKKRPDHDLDFDDYDTAGKCRYFIAKIDDIVLGAVRLVYDTPLPTQKFFDFKEPVMMRGTDPRQMVEISRLVVSRAVKDFGLPRNIVLLFFLKTMIDYAEENKIVAGYMFLKKGIRKKLRLLRVPIHLVRKYKQRYPRGGLLYAYFHDPKDRVIPGYFSVPEVQKFVDSVVNRSWFFKRPEPHHFILRNTFYNRFLRRLGII